MFIIELLVLSICTHSLVYTYFTHYTDGWFKQ